MKEFVRRKRMKTHNTLGNIKNIKEDILVPDPDLADLTIQNIENVRREEEENIDPEPEVIIRDLNLLNIPKKTPQLTDKV